MSVLGQPQHDWDDFLEEEGKPKRKWSLSRVVWLVVAIVVSAAVLIYYSRYWG